MKINGQYYDREEFEAYWISKPDDFIIVGDTNHHKKSRNQQSAHAPEQKKEKPRNQLEIHNNSITHVHTDAIVNAANTSLIDGSGVCGAIFKAAGSAALAKECNAIGYCEVGDAKITSACGLREKNGNKYIIHAVGPRYTDGRHGEPQQLESAYRRSLELAVRYGCRSITFPLISAGAYGYPHDAAWTIALSACRAFLDGHPDVGLDVVFVARDEHILKLGKEILTQLERERVEAAAPSNEREGEEKAGTGYVFFWKTDGEYGYMSNWYRAPFIIEGITYSCVEQYMMSRKALLFRDYAIFDRIMQSTNPREMKELGKLVKNYVHNGPWDACRTEVVYNACYAKFTQNPVLKERLLATGDCILVEASPKDEIWGIGLDAEQAKLVDPELWPGKGLLGKVLMQVREDLRRQASEE